MSDGQRRIYYSDMSDARTKLLEYFEERKRKKISDSEFGIEYFPYKMFKDLILHDERSFYYPFSFEQIDEMITNDKSIKIYSWDNGQGGAIRNFCYEGVFTYEHKGQYYAISPDVLDEGDELSRNAYHNIIPLWLKPYIFQDCGYANDEHYFILGFLYKTYGYLDNLYGYKINKDGIVEVADIFVNKDKVANKIESSVLPMWNDFHESTHLENNMICIPIMYQPKETRGYCLPFPSGRISVWKQDGNKYKRIGYQFDSNEKIIKDLRNYNANIVTLDLKPWIIRIDLMPNGSYRYVAWKNTDITQQPVLVLNNGYRVDPVEGNKGFMSLKEQYVFQNGQHFYIVSYEMVIYNGCYDIESPCVIVKKNEKVLLELKPN